MTVVDRALEAAARLVPVDPELRHELTADARVLARERGGVAGLAEVGAMLLLALELRAGAEEPGRAAVVAQLRRGAWLAAEVLLLHGGILLALALMTTAGSDQAPAVGWRPLTLALTGLLVATAALGRSRPVPARIILLATGLTLAVPMAGVGATVPPGVSTLLAAGLVAVALGRPCSATVAPTVALALAVAAVLSAGALAGGPEVAATIGHWSTLAVLLVLLGGAQGDPALGVAGAVVAGWRFVVVDPSGLIDLAAAMVNTGPAPDLVLRGLVMAAGLAVAVVVAHRGIRQAAAL